MQDKNLSTVTQQLLSSLSQQLPTHIVFYDVLLSQIQEFLHNNSMLRYSLNFYWMTHIQ